MPKTTYITKEEYIAMCDMATLAIYFYHSPNVRPLMSDLQYDDLMANIWKVEAEHPDWWTPASPTARWHRQSTLLAHNEEAPAQMQCSGVPLHLVYKLMPTPKGSFLILQDALLLHKNSRSVSVYENAVFVAPYILPKTDAIFDQMDVWVNVEKPGCSKQYVFDALMASDIADTMKAGLSYYVTHATPKAASACVISSLGLPLQT